MSRVSKLFAAFLALRDDPEWCRKSLTVGTDEYKHREVLSRAGLVGVWTKPGHTLGTYPWPQLTKKGEEESARLKM